MSTENMFLNISEPKSLLEKLLVEQDGGFQNKLYTKFIADKEHRIEPVAEALWMHKEKFYRIVRGAEIPTKNLAPGNKRKYEFPIDKIAPLVLATGDLDFLTYFTDPLGLELIPILTDETIKVVFGHLVKVLAVASGKKPPGVQSE